MLSCPTLVLVLIIGIGNSASELSICSDKAPLSSTISIFLQHSPPPPPRPPSSPPPSLSLSLLILIFSSGQTGWIRFSLLFFFHPCYIILSVVLHCFLFFSLGLCSFVNAHLSEVCNSCIVEHMSLLHTLTAAVVISMLWLTSIFVFHRAREEDRKSMSTEQ